MTSSARDRATDAAAGEVPARAAAKPFRLACFRCGTWQEFPSNAARQEWVDEHEREVGCTEFRYSNEPVPAVPAPAGDAPPVWWSPSRMSLIRDHGQPRGLVLHAHQHEERLSELPADAVPLVPAGGSALADEPGRCLALAARCQHCRNVEHIDGRGLLVEHDIEDSIRCYGSRTDEYERPDAVPSAGGSAPHQGATAADTAHREAALRKLADEWAQHARDQAELANRVDDAIASNVSAALWSCAEALRVALGAATTTAPEATDATR